MLVRHAQPEWVADGRQVSNPGLTLRGFDQARRVGERLAFESFDEVHVSPLLRAQQTAAPMARPTVTSEWLEEIRDPDWHGNPAEIVERAFRDNRARHPAEAQWSGLEGGERVRDFIDRIHDGSAKFLAERGIHRRDGELPLWDIERPYRRFLFVAHAGVGAALLTHLLGLAPTPWEWERFVIGHASICRVEAIPVAGAHTFSLTKLSDVEHLPNELRTR